MRQKDIARGGLIIPMRRALDQFGRMWLPLRVLIRRVISELETLLKPKITVVSGIIDRFLERFKVETGPKSVTSTRPR
jgi:hypothetical protein